MRLPIMKSKTTRSAEKKKGTYVGFKKLEQKLAQKSIKEDELDIQKDDEELESAEHEENETKEEEKDEHKNKMKKAVKNPAALAAYIGRKKYGKKAFQAMALKGRKKKK